MIDTSQPESSGAAWQEALERYLPDFVALFFPQAAREIAWSHGYERLDAELRQVINDTARPQADRLVRIARLSGEAALLYIHVEVKRQPGLAERMFACYGSLHSRYGQPVATLAVLVDDPDQEPASYHVAQLGCVTDFRFPAVRLLDFAPRQAELERDANPIAALVLAHFATHETRQSDRDPAETGALLDGIAAALEVRFGQSGATLMSQIRQIKDVPLLERLLQAASAANTLDELRALCAPPAA